MTIAKINAPQVPEPPGGIFSNCLVVGEQIFLSGMTASGPDGKAIGGNSMEAQARAVMGKIGHLLEGFPDLVKAKNHFPGATVTAVRSRITDPLERVPDSRVPIDEAYEHQRGPVDAVPF